MGRHKSENGLRAEKLVEQAKTYITTGGLFLFGDTFESEEIANRIAIIVRHQLNYAKMANRVTITVKNKSVYIGSRKENRETQLINMIKRLSLYVDDELLYDEAMELVFGGNNGR